MDINNIPEALTLPLRLKLISCLVESKKTFNELKDMVQATDGNLSVQLSKLEKWNYISSKKKLEGKKTKTTYEVTEFGICMLKEYVELLEKIIVKLD
jgi:DNA-binding HxlR family transcriptional regulator